MRTYQGAAHITPVHTKARSLPASARARGQHPRLNRVPPVFQLSGRRRPCNLYFSRDGCRQNTKAQLPWPSYPQLSHQQETKTTLITCYRPFKESYKMMRSTPLLLALVALLVPQAFALSPPWWDRADEIKTVLKADPSLEVTTNAPNSTDVVVTVNLSSGTAAKAQALADLLAPYGNVKFSGGSVAVKVTKDNEVFVPQALPTDATAAFNLAKTAMAGNTLFVRGVTVKVPMFPTTYYLLCQVKGVQYYADDLSQFSGMATELASSAMSKVYGITAMAINGNSGVLATSNQVCPQSGCP